MSGHDRFKEFPCTAPISLEEFGKCFGHPDFKEGVSAFLEKRKAQFKRQ